jgi:hypothetical protein
VVWTPGPDVLPDAQVVLVLPLALAIHCIKSDIGRSAPLSSVPVHAATVLAPTKYKE